MKKTTRVFSNNSSVGNTMLTPRQNDTDVSSAKDAAVQITYTNYRNETSIRTVIPQQIWYGSTKWHPESQWLLDAFDVDKKAHRSFAMADIRSWSR